MKAYINKEGKAVSVDIISSSGHKMLDHAAVRASSKWIVEPAQIDGKSTDSWAIIQYNFILE